MKKAIAILLTLFATLQMSAQGAPAEGPKITFEADVIDFGNVAQGSEQIRTFKFTNTGTAPLVIQSIKGQCGCTSIPDSWPKDPIPPGGTGTFQVKYDTTVRVGMFDKKIIITSNAVNGVTEVKIKGNVLPAGSGG
ncbi:MAG: DUF1573 domain-containing protein [Bacteroidia bacterium]|nr:DUF1573 domain-containing protein [Bacteroidia bacterium]